MSSSCNVQGHGPPVCRNCGQVGHIVRMCRFPVSSAGCIAVRRGCGGGELEYLFVQRKHSLNFSELVLGKYASRDSDFGYLGMMLSNMTGDERASLLGGDFLRIWRDTWQTPHVTGKVLTEFDRARARYEEVLPHLPDLLASNPSPYSSPEWGFPKGRRKLNETTLDCAVREFVEETGFGSVTVVDDRPVTEEFVASNGVAYRHSYYVVTVNYDGPHEVPVDRSNPAQCREVRRVRWFPFSQALAHIRPRNWQRAALLKDLNGRLIHALSTDMQGVSGGGFSGKVHTSSAPSAPCIRSLRDPDADWTVAWKGDEGGGDT